MATSSFPNFTLFFFLTLLIAHAYASVIKLSSTSGNLVQNIDGSQVTPNRGLRPVDFVPLQLIGVFSLYVNNLLTTTLFIGFFLSLIVLLTLCFITRFNKLNNFSVHDVLVPLTIPLFLVLLQHASSYLDFLFYLELIGYTFYFQFVSAYSSRAVSRIVDLFLFYYWSSFFGTIFLFYSAYRLLSLYNTLNFVELGFFENFQDPYFSALLTVGLLIKLGASGVHFMKADFYKYISLVAVLNFSIISSYAYVYIYIYFLSLMSGFYFMTCITYFLSFFGVFWLALMLKHINNYSLFMGYSGVITVTLSLLLLL